MAQGTLAPERHQEMKMGERGQVMGYWVDHCHTLNVVGYQLALQEVEGEVEVEVVVQYISTGC